MPPAKASRHAKRKRQRSQSEDTPAETTQPAPANADARFSAAAWDPRFARVPKRARKASADPRFDSQLASNPAFRTTRAPVDRFGRPRAAAASRNRGGGDDDSDDSDAGEDNEEEVAMLAGHGLPAAAFGESDLSSDDDDDDDEEADGLDSDAVEAAQPEDDIPRGRATRRLAVIGLDWATTRAVDILASFNSFIPATGSVDFVEVHPSKLGLERLAEEAKFGPLVVGEQDLRVGEQAKADREQLSERAGAKGKGKTRGMDDETLASIREDAGLDDGDDGGHDDRSDDRDDSDEEAEHGGDDEVLSEDDHDGDESDDDSDDDQDAEQKAWRSQLALRKYEEERLKYYYAVAQFADARSADAVYEQCDGVEFAQTGRVLDLRFIPEDMEIETSARDRAEDVPEGYEPPEVNLSSLNNSSVKLSWDNDAPDRIILKKKAFGKHQIDENNLRAYLASSDEEDDEGDGKSAQEKAAEIERKRKLLLGDGEDEDGDDEDEDDDGEGGVARAKSDEKMALEISFEPGMLEKGEEIMRRKQEREELDEETPWERRLRRQKERKLERKKQHARKLAGKNDEDDDGEDDETAAEQVGDDATFDDPFFKTERSLEDAAAAEDPEEQGRDRKKRKDKKKKKKDDVRDDSVAPDDEVDEETARRRKGELELLMMDDLSTKANSPADAMRQRAEARDSDDEDEASKRGKRSRGRRRAQRAAADKETTPANQADPKPAVDVEDSRFQGLFDSHLFAMDPTHPKFKDNETTRSILSEKGRRSRARRNKPADTGAAPAAGAAQSDLKDLTAKLKARAKVKKRVRQLSGRGASS